MQQIEFKDNDTTHTNTIAFDNEEALAIIMALELIAENPDISMTVYGQTYDVSPRYLTDTALSSYVEYTIFIERLTQQRLAVLHK